MPWVNSYLSFNQYKLTVGNQQLTYIDKAVISKIYQAHTLSWPQGGSIAPLDLSEENLLRSEFSSAVVGKSADQLKTIWAQSLFTGKAGPPKVMASGEEVKKAVVRKKNAIGYIRASSVDDSVRVVFTQ